MLKYFFLLLKIFFVFSTVAVVAIFLTLYYYSRDLPSYSKLKKYYPPMITKIYSSDGKFMNGYAKENRIFIPIESIPQSLINAFITSEDKSFYDNIGIDFLSIIRAAILNISHIFNDERVEGGSTITQQLVKNFLLTPERSIERKIKEAILSYMISSAFSKDKIMELYLNQIYLGNNSYGVAAAALGYFNKSVEDLTISESALLAALPKAPSKYNPFKYYDNALARRNYVLRRMYNDGYINKDEYDRTISEKIVLKRHNPINILKADYYSDKVKDEVINMFGKEYFYTAGLTIISCADSKIQQDVTEALRNGIRKYDISHSYRGAIGNIDIKNWKESIKEITRPAGMLEYELAVVLKCQNDKAKIGTKDGKITNLLLSDIEYDKKKNRSIKDLFKVGDVIIVQKQKDKFFLRQIPEVNGAMMVMEPFTGRVLGLDGGYDYEISKFDRATQAQRQPGSLIKPFIYLTALENNIKPNAIFSDSPIEMKGGLNSLWRPKNWDNKFFGPITFRKGLERSRNMVTIRVAQRVGIKKVCSTIKRFGINSDPTPVFSVVLGSLETTLEKMINAYTIFASGGRKVEPHYIELIKDRNGNVIYNRDNRKCVMCNINDSEYIQNAPEISEIKAQFISDEDSVFQLNSILQGVVLRGTGKSAQVLNKSIAMKTGTTNNSFDIWSIGYTPSIVVGNYLGFDQPKTLGKDSWAASLSVPIFVEFMQKHYNDINFIEFEKPSSISLVPIDYNSGRPVLHKKTGNDVIMEAFKIEQLHNIPGDVHDKILDQKEDSETESDDIYY